MGLFFPVSRSQQHISHDQNPGISSLPRMAATASCASSLPSAPQHSSTVHRAPPTMSKRRREPRDAPESLLHSRPSHSLRAGVRD